MRDPVAVHIAQLRLEKNAIVLNLRDPYAYDDEYDSDDEDGEPKQDKPAQVRVIAQHTCFGSLSCARLSSVHAL